MPLDSFEELTNQLNQMSDDERREKIEELQLDCVCPICPTYNKCAKDTGENIFCIKGKSNCIKKEKGCMCPTCPFAAKFKIGVIYNFYCMRGLETDQSKL